MKSLFTNRLREPLSDHAYDKGRVSTRAPSEQRLSSSLRLNKRSYVCPGVSKCSFKPMSISFQPPRQHLGAWDFLLCETTYVCIPPSAPGENSFLPELLLLVSTQCEADSEASPYEIRSSINTAARLRCTSASRSFSILFHYLYWNTRLTLCKIYSSSEIMQHNSGVFRNSETIERFDLSMGSTSFMTNLNTWTHLHVSFRFPSFRLGRFRDFLIFLRD